MIGLLISLTGMIGKQKLINACQHPKNAQVKTLRRILNDARDTVYGKEHHFDEILSCSDKKLISEFRSAVKPSEYEDYRSYVERMMQGEPDVLFVGKPSLYATTSGSTGSPKYVPLSEAYLENVYSSINRLWLYRMVSERRKMFSGQIVSVVGKCEEGRSDDGTVIGSVSGFANKRIPGFIKKLYVFPPEVYGIQDYSTRNYVLMRLALERNVTFYATPNPSTVLELQNTVDQWLDEIIEDIGKGTLSGKFDIPADVRTVLSTSLKPNPARAYELRMMQSRYERVLPRHYWPNLCMLSTWKCGNTQIYLQKMRDFFPSGMFHYEMGYFATECRLGIVMDDSNDSVFFPHMHFYEFKREKDLNDPKARFFNLWELKVGERYCPFVTTSSGLYRYNMNDIVQISFPYYSTPRAHMVQKVNGIVSITGEKLYEDQFIKAVEKAQQSTGFKLDYYSGYVNLQKSRYDWYFEFSDKKINHKKAEFFGRVVDKNLMQLNIEYESKRSSFRLKDPVVYILGPNTFDKFKEFILKRNNRDASRFKPNVLAQNELYHRLIAKFIQKKST